MKGYICIDPVNVNRPGAVMVTAHHNPDNENSSIGITLRWQIWPRDVAAVLRRAERELFANGAHEVETDDKRLSS